jgi:ADP-heptose:LPS heptosyltransferase
VVSVDTSIAHLAGAMGRPVFILLPFTPDWRWGFHGTKTPWYPSARLLRQQRPLDWTTAIQMLIEALTELHLI